MIRKLTQIVVLAAALVLVIGCESKITAPPHSGTSLSLKFDIADASPKLIAAIDQFRVTVFDPAVPETVVVSQLTFDPNGFIVGQIDSLPAEINLVFTAEALDMQASTVIFRGSANATLVADVVNDVLIELSPVVPLMKLTPRFHNILSADTATQIFDVKIFNVDSLYGVSFRVRYDQTYLIAVSATLDSNYNPSEVIFFESDQFDTFGPFKVISITETDSTRALVDANGDAVLCNIGFVLEQQFPAAESTYITIEPTGMTHQNRSLIPVGILYNDDAFVRITP